jgi:hypothetical protein
MLLLLLPLLVGASAGACDDYRRFWPSTDYP